MTLPAPRLQLRWRAPTKREIARRSVGHAGDYKWTCDYELVLPLGEHDCRRSKRRPEAVVRLGRTFTSTGRSMESPNYPPFRDGAHAHWDSEALGGIPVFVIAPDGSAIEQKRPVSSHNRREP